MALLTYTQRYSCYDNNMLEAIKNLFADRATDRLILSFSPEDVRLDDDDVKSIETELNLRSK